MCPSQYIVYLFLDLADTFFFPVTVSVWLGLGKDHDFGQKVKVKVTFMTFRSDCHIKKNDT